MEGCFTFQWGRVVFQMRGASFLSGMGVRHMGGASVLIGGGGVPKKIIGCPPPSPTHPLSTFLALPCKERKGCVLLWLATCARKLKVSIRVRLLALRSNCLANVCVCELGGSGKRS